MSAIEQLLLSREFSYLPPLFYRNPYALRCKLGAGGAAGPEDKWQRRFVRPFLRKYRCAVIPDLETGELAEEGLRKRDRILCYADGKRFNSRGLIRRLVRVDFGGKGALDTSFVSFENECILSIYDDRGCDVVFASREKYRQFFSLLSQYLLDYDLEEMKRRFEE